MKNVLPIGENNVVSPFGTPKAEICPKMTNNVRWMDAAMELLIYHPTEVKINNFCHFCTILTYQLKSYASVYSI